MADRAHSAARTRMAERLDAAFLRMRRLMVKPPTTTLPVACLGRSVDFAKIHACLVVAELETERPPTVKDVAAALELEHSTASRLLGDAEREGLVRRGTDPDDRRRTTVSLTAAGRALVAESNETRTWSLAEVFRDWTSADLAELCRLLERMNETVAARVPQVIEATRARQSEALGRRSR